MEGTLKIWIDPLQQWKDRYFILNDDSLIYSELQSSEKKSMIHLKIAEITQVAEDPLQIVITSGAIKIQLLAPTEEQQISWYNGIKDAQMKAKNEFEGLSGEQLKEKALSSTQIDPKIKQMLVDSSQEKIEKSLVEAYEAGARFEETLLELLPLITKTDKTTELIGKLQDESHYIKRNLQDCVEGLENERKRLFRAAQVIANQLEMQNDEERLFHDNHDNERAPDENKQEEQYLEIEEKANTEFQSTLDDGYFYKEKQAETILQSDSSVNDKDKSGNQIALVSYLAKNCPIKHRLLTTNPAYLTSHINDAPSRLTLPAEKDPNEKINVWQIVKDSIGKDLSSFAVPVYLNEPISMLQKVSEQMEYAELLDEANKTDDQGLALCYIMGFGVSSYAGTINRLKKPFNPLLGETFEYVDEKKGFKFISEQVSHHPPISAGYAESPNYYFWADSNIKSQFYGRSFEARMIGKLHVQLRRLNHKYSFNKCTTSAKNIIIGQMYLDHFGEMVFKNETTGVNGVLNLKEKATWSDKGQYEISGWVKDINKKTLYTLSGHWNDKLTATNALTKEQILVWKRNPLPFRSRQYYNYTDYAFQLNHLSSDLIKFIAPTDSRLRPDQRALEYGLLDIASQEKLRLEHKQRIKRKENEASGKQHQIVFFEEIKDPKTGEKEYHYKGGYWEAREKKDWSNLNLPDIY